MRMVDIIAKKRDGKELSEEEIRWFVESYSSGEVPDYQASAFAMAIYFQDMTQKESAALTYAMAESGDQLDLSAIEGIKVDKHSTGGVGDKTTLIIGPIVAACGVPVAKMSGRGLGHTGGTIDKLESFRGFETEIPKEEFVNLVNEHKIAVAGQSGNLTPADKKLYALRDVTATVNSIPMIASSVMSKKIAAGADAIVLDVKAGSGAFMKEVEDAKRLAEAMVEIGQSLDRKTMAVISNMDQPLGRTVGNALEVKEAIETLQGDGPEDLHELSVKLSSYMLVAGGKADSLEQAEKMVLQVIKNGEALEKMKAFVENQHGDAAAVDNPDSLAAAEHRVEVKAKASGYVHGIEAEEIGVSAMLLGAGRATKDDVLDYSVGIELTKKIGDIVQKGDTIAIMHVNDQDSTESAEKISQAFTISEAAVEKPVLIYETVQ
ncbi:pyrimidine-nucleoside phosphorylase [Marinococcus halophilus]|uniref:Pyrimidine-nucleoside phosphorylase n=1 Tax=Marinococcus halophilus TaxID=1371 RepID=A0A510Y3P4_MARHA|nr:pyrimidine-nucleoside phosphorylase [Marinococcus halophilus]OZT80895.1 pyrimidine-nucleoside phosphorylase [Marinococcus halophilus]GEK57952.1 pyrimidine-nucleoside phosphorylase [Marinococcus halophilus]